MVSSRLFSALFIVGVASGAAVVACGDDGGGGGGTPDAKVYMDAKVFMDAPMATGIGTLCTAAGGGSGDPTKCPTTDPQCVTLNGTVFFCTKSCGTSTGSGTPPTGGTAICMQNETSSGTPVCALYQGSGSAYNWSCGIACGTAGSNNLGTCPTGLTCTSNFCQ